MLTRKFFKAVLTTTAVLALASPAHATLVARYLDATPGIDAYYDGGTGLTWLSDVHHGAGSVTLTDPSSLTSTDANSWAIGLSTGGVSWRLPSTIAIGNSEMGSLWDAGNFTSAFFQNLVTAPAMRPVYWSNQAGDNLYWYMIGSNGQEDTNNNSILAYTNTYSLAVHDGDVGRSTESIDPPGGTVPEPESIWLALTALGALALARRLRQG